jgi:hypothetical protein
MKNKITDQDIKNYQAYERIRARGTYNMYDLAARHATGLSKEDYIFVMENYDTLHALTEEKASNDYLLDQVDHS